MLTVISNVNKGCDTRFIMLDLEKLSIIKPTNHFEIIKMIYTCQ